MVLPLNKQSAIKIKGDVAIWLGWVEQCRRGAQHEASSAGCQFHDNVDYDQITTGPKYASVIGWCLYSALHKVKNDSTAFAQALNTVNHTSEYMACLILGSLVCLDIMCTIINSTQVPPGQGSFVFISSMIRFGSFCVWHSVYSIKEKVQLNDPLVKDVISTRGD